MAQLEEDSAVEEQGNCKGLSWRSRNTSSWWTSAVDLSSTFLSKMDQVPASLVSFTLPWHSSTGGDESKAPQIEAEPTQIAEKCELARGGETVETYSSCILKGGDMARGAESRRRTKRMPVDVAPAGPKQGDDDDDAPIRSKKLSAVSQDFLFGQQGTEEMGRLRRHRRHLSHIDTARMRRLDDVTDCSSRSWADTNPPRPLPPPPSANSSPRLDYFSTLKPIRLQCEDAAVLGGSMRVTTRSCEENKSKPSTSLPSSPRPKDSRSSKLLRTLGISTTHETPEKSRKQVVNNLKVEPLTNGSVQEKNADVKVSKKKSSWLLKWKWGSSKPKTTIAPPHTSRNPSWGCATSASTAVVPRTRDENIVESNDSFRDCHGSFGDCHGSFRMIETPRSSNYGSFRETFEDCHGSFRSMASFSESAECDLSTPPADLSLTIGDVAALCNSSLKFVFKCREVQQFNKFLRSRRKRLLSAGSDCFTVVLSGNDPEVSSMVAAMCYAWYLDNAAPEVTGQTSRLAIPMISIPRDEMRKHKDAAWLFDACGIDVAALLFADEVNLSSLVRAGRIKFSTIGQDVLVTKNEVGSVCTLLGEKLVAEAKHVLEPRYMKTLLLAGVLLDTENLDFASMRDTEMTNSLLVGCGSLERNAFFDQLRNIDDGYGDSKQRIEKEEEAEQEQSDDKDSVFTQSQDHTSTSEAGTSSSSVDEDSPRLKPRSFFKFAHSAPTSDDKAAVAHIRKAATQFVSSSRGAKPSRMRKKLLLYHV